MIEIRKGDTIIFGTDVALDDYTKSNVEKALKRILDEHGVDAVVFDRLTVQAVIKGNTKPDLRVGPLPLPPEPRYSDH